MPLKAGKPGSKSFVNNIREMMHSFKRTGKIGNSRPASAGKANKQAVAAAYSKAREG
jgi:hypothetical protein